MAATLPEFTTTPASALNSSLDPSSVSGGAGQPRSKDQWRRSTACGLPANKRKRNTHRGLRSEIKIIERRIKRSRKRNLARRATRRIKSGKLGPYGAQEPEKTYQTTGSKVEPRGRTRNGKQTYGENEKRKDKVKTIENMGLEYNKPITFGTFNCKGMMKSGRREEIEHYMKTKGIQIMALQETYINYTSMEKRKNYTFYFSGNPRNKNTKGEVHHDTNAGVGIVINNELANYVTDIEPIDERLMYMTMDGTIPINIIVTYMPTSVENTEIKEKAYENPQKHTIN